MPNAGVSVAATAPRTTKSATAKAVRGSSLLLLGKVLALGLNFVSQVLIVRYLTKNDYGAFAYALSIVMLFKGLVLFGIPDTLARFLPYYRERGRQRAMPGAMVFGFGVVLGLGLLCAVGVALVAQVSGARFIADSQARDLAIILAFLIPLEAFNDLLTTLFAVFASPRAIFFRRSVLAPGLRLGLIVALMLSGAGVVELAAGYVAISAVGVLIYISMFGNLLRHDADMSFRAPRSLDYPVKEMLAFAVPTLATAFVWVLMESSDAILLGHFRDSAAVASFRAVLPVARLNQFVLLAFGTLYTPLAARVFARGEDEELSDLYWQTAAWVAVLTFPVFVLSFAFARPLVETLFGARYSNSAVILTLLSFSYFIQSATGFNGVTLKVFRKMRYSVVIDSTAAVLNIGLNLYLAPRYGAVGVAVGTTLTMTAHNVLKQLGLWRFTPIAPVPRNYLPFYGAVVGVSALMVVLQWLTTPNIVVALALGAVGSLFVLWVALHTLRIATVFPEIERVPIVGALLRPFLRPA
jgi:O-antigen/teichoic acid export membrane protein